MSHDAIASWVEKAKAGDADLPSAVRAKPAINDEYKTRGGTIIEIAEKIRPWLAQMFEGVRDENGMLVQPARIRGIALNVAQSLTKDKK